MGSMQATGSTTDQVATRDIPVGTEPVDLTLLIAEELPCWWSTHMPFQHKTFNYFVDRDDSPLPLRNRTGQYQTRWMLMDEHTGTHVDAPAHFIPEEGSGLPDAGPMGAVTIDRVPLAQLMGPAVVVDVPDDLPGAAPGVSPMITRDVVEGFEDRHGPFTAGDVVLFRSGWDRHYAAGEDGDGYCHDALVTKSGPGWPAPDPAAMSLLLDRGVRCVGTDSPSMGSSHDGRPVHVEGLSRGACFVEALTGLGRLPVRGAWFCATPLNLARGTGAPARAFAFLPPATSTREA
jgi:kynurenine formamidase